MPDDVHRRLYARVPGRLLSLHESSVVSSRRWLERAEQFDTRDIEVMFDSGAFTAWTKEHDAIDVYWLLKQYRRFDALCGRRFKAVWFISLDVIPGSPGRLPTRGEIADAIRRSDLNHRVLKDVFGDRVIPVFHQGEGLERLLELRQINSSYIGVSPQNQIHEAQRRRWAHDVHAKLKGTVATHGLATTGGEMMQMIDWRSVDSASWVMQGANGRVMIEWDGQLLTLPISERSSKRLRLGRHWDTVAFHNKGVRKLVEEICAGLEISPEHLRADHAYRLLFNAHVMTEWSKRPLAREVIA
jgi:hypothetical protein